MFVKYKRYSRKFPFVRQYDSADCGPACLQMLSKYYQKEYELNELRHICNTGKDGTSLLSLSEAAEKIGFEAIPLKINVDDFNQEIPLPCILFWGNNHYVVLYKVSVKRNGRIKSVQIADPKSGPEKLDWKTFCQKWVAEPIKENGYLLLLQPTASFPKEKQSQSKEKRVKRLNNMYSISKYFSKFKRYYFQIALGVIASSSVSLIFPFLTQNIVDVGIKDNDANFIGLILLFQLGIILSTTFIELIRRQLLLHISSRTNITMISEFLSKLMRLEINFYDNKNLGDIMNRIQDQKRIESFISGSVLNIVFVILNFLLLSFVLAVYDLKVLGVFLIGSLFSFLWITKYINKKKQMDYNVFNAISSNNDTLYEIIHGMQEIKLNSLESFKKKELQKKQKELFALNLKNLTVEQYQLTGSTLITQVKNLVITYISATNVISGELSLGMMLSISMIVGQLNSPVEELISFIRTYSQAKISLERMNEVYDMPDEEESHSKPTTVNSIDPYANNLNLIENPKDTDLNHSIYFNGVTFQYTSRGENYILSNLKFSIPIGKTTAIVGDSGGGKTTLLKLLLKFYTPTYGNININGKDLNTISARAWRKQCGVVMQEGYIFNNTIARNIATSEDAIDQAKLVEAAKSACIYDYISSLSNGFETKIGRNGSALSTGQRQRILIARALYKNPDFIFLDEATSALDSNNEARIIENMQKVFRGKTVLVIAHRLSTIKNADQIIVLHNGETVEIGDHETLLRKKGHYFTLVKKQLEKDITV